MPVEGSLIIRFGRYTTVREINDTIMDYPLCTYALTTIDALPRPCDMPESFTDVIGVITGVSPITQYHSARRSTPSTKRVIYLSDLSGYQISIVLWGERATAFDGEAVLRTAGNGPVVAIFVGTLVKPFEGRRGLSGGAPCRWYINEDLPEITELDGRVPLVQGISLPRQTAAEISAQTDLETKTVKELVDLNIWEHAGSGSGLNSLGEVLAEDAMLGQVNSSEVVSDLTGDPASTDLVTSVVSSEETLMQTPTSVLKPSKTRHGEFAASSSVKRALLQESPTRSLPEDVLELGSRVVTKEIGLALVDPSESSLAVSGADLTDNKRRRDGSNDVSGMGHPVMPASHPARKDTSIPY